MQEISIYILIGLIWCLITDLYISKMPDNSVRVRYIIFWPITLGAFVYGFIESFINHINRY